MQSPLKGTYRGERERIWCNYALKWAKRLLFTAMRSILNLFGYVTVKKRRKRQDQGSCLWLEEQKPHSFPSRHTHLPSRCHTAFGCFVSPRAWNDSCFFCSPSQIAQKILSILQKCWKFSTLKHSKVSDIYPDPFSNRDLSLLHVRLRTRNILTVPDPTSKVVWIFFPLLKVIWIFLHLLTACATEPSPYNKTFFRQCNRRIHWIMTIFQLSTGIYTT